MGYKSMVPGCVTRWTAGITLCSLALLSAAAESASQGLSLGLKVSLVCRAEVQSIEKSPTGQQLDITISELCNGGSGYTLILQHDGKGVTGMTYDNAQLVNTRSSSTILAQRDGAWRGTRMLTIQTDGLQSPVIHGVRLQSKQPQI